MRRWIVGFVLLVLVGVTTTGLVLGLSPRVDSWVGLPLAWTGTKPAQFEGQTLTVGARTLSYGRAHGEPDRPALTDGARWLHFPASFDGYDFDKVVVQGSRIVAVLEMVTEGPGPSFAVLESRDGGETFTQLSDVPKPYFGALFDGLVVEEDRIEIAISLDGDGFLAEAWWAPWHRAEARVLTRYSPSVAAGNWALISKDGGHTFVLRRR